MFGRLTYQNVALEKCTDQDGSQRTRISYLHLLHSKQNTINSSDYINTNDTNSTDGTRSLSISPLAYYNNNYVGFDNKQCNMKWNSNNNRVNRNKFERQTSSISQRRQGRIVTTSDLICWAFQCARGMDYLTMRKVCVTKFTLFKLFFDTLLVDSSRFGSPKRFVGQ